GPTPAPKRNKPSGLVERRIRPVLGALQRSLQRKPRFGDLVHGDVVEGQLTTHGSTLLPGPRRRISLRAHGHAVLLKALHRIIRMEHHHDAVILHTHAKAKAHFAHAQVGGAARAVVVHDPVTTAKAGEDQVHVGVAEHSITRRRVDLVAHVGARRVELGQHIVTHVVHDLAFLHDGTTTRHAGGKEQAAQACDGSTEYSGKGETGRCGNHGGLLGWICGYWSATISKSWVMLTPARTSMIDAEQYFSAESSTARRTFSGS